MTLNFKTAAICAGTLCATLTLVWGFGPDLLLQQWGVPYSEPVGLLARRNAALFAGLATMLLLARNVPPGTARASMCGGVGVACLALAGLGIFEYMTGHAGVGIFSAVLVEIAMSATFTLIWKADKAITSTANPDF